MERDHKVFDIIQKESQRQTHGIELIASESNRGSDRHYLLNCINEKEIIKKGLLLLGIDAPVRM